MGVDRQFISFFGVELNDWLETFGSIANTHYFMLREYVSEGASTVDSSEASDTHKFLYPFDIEQIYFLEGTAEGQITLVAVSCTSCITDYRVTICKANRDDNSEKELGTTGVVTVNDVLVWDTPNSVGEEMVYPFYIHISPEKKITEKERLYLKVEVTCSDNCTHLYHSNDATWDDIRIDIPFKGL
jgi:hypothetical protein